MASGDLLATWDAGANQPPAANYATLDTRNSILVLDFDATTDESMVFAGVMPANYAGGGVTVRIDWMASSATSGACGWQTAFERMNTDEDSDSFAAANSASTATNGTSGIVTRTSIAHTSGAQMDSIAAGEPFRLRINRDADGSAVTDDMAGDAEVVLVSLIET